MMEWFKKYLNKTKNKKVRPNSFVSLDETRAPNVKQYLRGLRNYYVLSQTIKVGFKSIKNGSRETLQLLQYVGGSDRRMDYDLVCEAQLYKYGI